MTRVHVDLIPLSLALSFSVMLLPHSEIELGERLKIDLQMYF